jgi:hypothetical protein
MGGGQRTPLYKSCPCPRKREDLSNPLSFADGHPRTLVRLAIRRRQQSRRHRRPVSADRSRAIAPRRTPASAAQEPAAGRGGSRPGGGNHVSRADRPATGLYGPDSGCCRRLAARRRRAAIFFVERSRFSQSREPSRATAPSRPSKKLEPAVFQCSRSASRGAHARDSGRRYGPRSVAGRWCCGPPPAAQR